MPLSADTHTRFPLLHSTSYCQCRPCRGTLLELLYKRINNEDIMKLYRLFRDDLDAMESRINARFDRVEQQVDDLKGHIDHLYGQQETREVEEGAINYQLGQHEDWIEQAAPQVGVPYRRAA